MASPQQHLQRWSLSTERTNTMKDIAVFGAGGFGKEVACLIKIINASKYGPKWNFIGFFDDDESKVGSEVSVYGKVIGTSATLNAWSRPLDVAVAVGSVNALRAIVGKINNPLVDFPNLIHPTFAAVDNTFAIGKGNIIQGCCYASCDVKIGNFNIFNGFVGLGHDVAVGNFNVFMPEVKISGEVAIEEGNFFGVGSIVLQQIKIGNNVKLGAGSVLMRRPKDGNLYIGVPATKF